jgi:O-methyltransferase
MTLNVFKILERRFRQWRYGERVKLDYYADGIGVTGRNLAWRDEPSFARAWAHSAHDNRAGWEKLGGTPDIRWRAHTCCWAAKQALSLDGDFIECGVHTGLLSVTVCHYLNFSEQDRKFYLFDTFEGVPLDDDMKAADTAIAVESNERIYSDVYEVARRNFSQFKNCHLVRGALPGSLGEIDLDKIAYLSIDMNSALYERKTIEELWPKIVTGAPIVIDDYAFRKHEEQFEMWNTFCTQKNQAVLCLPTGQGLVIKR